MDPSLRNWGMAAGLLDIKTMELTALRLDVCQPVLPTSKQVRQNSLDLESAKQLFHGIYATCKQADAVFVEVPVGSQSARAMASYALCCGVLGSLRALGINFFEVTATEVKMAGHGSKTATKDQMITWGLQKYPNANWPYHNGKLSEAKAEHMADALAAIHAGIAGNQFQQMLSLARARAA